ncbi:MAG: VOC family protein [Leptothrix sp. (in: b-proteobacteria)]
MNIVKHGIILFVERYAECVAFYRDVVALRVAYAKASLTCFDLGSAYLMVEEGGVRSTAEKDRAQNPTVLRFDVSDLAAAASELESKACPVEQLAFEWGSIGIFTDPDGNRCELKQAKNIDI